MNKNIFLKELDNLETGTGTDLAAAFQEALDMMQKSIEKGLTSSCDHVIILITDGESTEYFKLIIYFHLFIIFIVHPMLLTSILSKAMLASLLTLLEMSSTFQ